jgi:dTDP-glucose 4,6-dehydratase
MAFEIRKAERRKAKLRLGIAGASGGGKTASSLLAGVATIPSIRCSLESAKCALPPAATARLAIVALCGRRCSRNRVVAGGGGSLGLGLAGRLGAIDNLVTGNLANIEHLSGNEDYRFVKHNVSNFILLPEEKLDYVFHFASPASPIDYLELPIPTLKVGALGTHNTLGLAKAKGAAFLLASTSECYGDPLVHPQKEDYWGNVNPIGPRGVYDEAKRFAEAITMAYHRFHGMDTKIVRIFNTYGPRMRLRDGRVVPAFIGQALENQPLTIFGDGSQTRSFCYVSDLIDGIFRLSQSDFHEPVNIGNPREMTIKQFAEENIRITGTSAQIEYRPLPVDDPKVRQPDIGRARKILNWEPKVPFEKGIVETIDYFRGCLERGMFGERTEIG